MRQEEWSFIILRWICFTRLVMHAWKSHFRVVTKISSCQGNTTSRRGIKQLGSSFLSVFSFYFSMKVARGPLHSSWGKSSALTSWWQSCIWVLSFPVGSAMWNIKEMCILVGTHKMISQLVLFCVILKSSLLSLFNSDGPYNGIDLSCCQYHRVVSNSNLSARWELTV